MAAAGLKHRAVTETRGIPIPPILVAMLRAYIARYGTGPGGRLFRTARGGPLNDTGYGEVWQRARPLALTPAQHTSPVAQCDFWFPPIEHPSTLARSWPEASASPQE